MSMRVLYGGSMNVGNVDAASRASPISTAVWSAAPALKVDSVRSAGESVPAKWSDLS